MPKRAKSKDEGGRRKDEGTSQTADSEVHDEVEVMMQKMLENLLTAQEAAALMGTNASRVRQLILEDRIAAVKKGVEWIVYTPSVLKYMKTRRVGRPPSGSKK